MRQQRKFFNHDSIVSGSVISCYLNTLSKANWPKQIFLLLCPPAAATGLRSFWGILCPMNSEWEKKIRPTWQFVLDTKKKIALGTIEVQASLAHLHQYSKISWKQTWFICLKIKRFSLSSITCCHCYAFPTHVER